MITRPLLFLSLVAITSAAELPRPIPPPGVPLSEPLRIELQQGADALAMEVAKLKTDYHSEPAKLNELPNVEVFHKAVHWALKYDEFMDAKQFATARDILLQGQARAKDLRAGGNRWNSATGLVVRAYRSEIDGSVQPYSLVLPADWKPGDKARPLHFWFHGRGEKLTELSFIAERQREPGQFTPEGAIVCHLYGRYCNANHFAGESDLFEALADIQKHYAIDERRLVIRGFSMGGAACWHFAMHHPGLWAAAAPGAGFSETEEFFSKTLYGQGATPIAWWERHLWRWYDATVYARNLHGLPLVAYSGEIDRQKQAADIMLRFAAKENLAFSHIIGPDTPHRYHPDSKPVIEKFIDVALVKRNDPAPKKIFFTTYSLIYPRRAWVEIRGMQKQWERADIDAAIEKETLTIKTRNITALRLSPPFAAIPRKATPKLVIDGVSLPLSAAKDCWQAMLMKRGGKWEIGTEASTGKRPGQCGPVDHAFMSAFLHVRPTGKAMHESTGAWVKSELEHARWSWRRVFRGDAPIKDDTAISDDDIKNNNLVVWGDPSSNAVLKRVLDRLPVKWTEEKLEFRGYALEAKSYAPILILPNPLNPQKYIVLNSGHTFREFALLNNSDQTPKLPDWAIVDVRTPADAKWPGLIYDAGFFDEQWR